MMDGHLRQRGIRVTQARIRSCMHKIDPEGIIIRWREVANTSGKVHSFKSSGIVAY